MALIDAAAAHSRLTPAELRTWRQLWPRIHAELWRRIDDEGATAVDAGSALLFVLGRPGAITPHSAGVVEKPAIERPLVPRMPWD